MERKAPSSARLIFEGMKMGLEEMMPILIAFWAGAAFASLFFLPEIFDGAKAHRLEHQEVSCKAAPL